MIAASKIELTVGNDRRRDNLPSGMKLFHQGSLRFCIDGREREMSLFLYLYPVRNESFAERQAHGTKQLNLSTDRQNLIVCGAMKNVPAHLSESFLPSSIPPSTFLITPHTIRFYRIDRI